MVFTRAELAEIVGVDAVSRLMQLADPYMELLEMPWEPYAIIGRRYAAERGVPWSPFH